MQNLDDLSALYEGRSPRGERGLKSTLNYGGGSSMDVAPLAGSVD